VTIPRWLLDKHFAGDKRMIAAMEQHTSDVTDTVAATAALKDATVIVLSANGDFTNERVLEVGDGINVEVTDSAVRLSVENVAMTEGYPVTLIAQGMTELILPLTGTLVSSASPVVDIATVGDYADDTAAAAGGVPVGGVYRNGSALMVRAT
jgi:hypothetical protein